MIAKQCRCDIRHQRECAGFVGLVLNGDIDLRIVAGDGSHRVDRVVPHRAVIGLKRIIETVLTHPKRHQVAAHFGKRVDALLRDIDSGLTDRLVGMREGTEFEPGIGVVAHGEAVERDTHAVHRLAQLAGRGVLKMIRIVEIGGVQSSRRHALQNVDGRDPVLAGPVGFGTDLESIEAGGIVFRGCQANLHGQQ